LRYRPDSFKRRWFWYKPGPSSASVIPSACDKYCACASSPERYQAYGADGLEGMPWQPDSGELWAAVIERDELGNDLVPDI